MGVFSGPDISESGLVLAFDGGNYKSFKGEVTTNLIPSPTINAYPTTGNGWGTYNTNQYGSGNFFSIGTVSSVTNNIVTMTSAHGLRTYDVMRPQSTGGGVIANNDYFIKKLSDTTFSLHAYNSSQDGSQGYINPATGTHKVYDSIATDTRISINASGFPTMWWGAPHLPNSGLVKELRYGEFNAIPNLLPNDCIRLHYIRTDDVKDGMSYGVDCTVTPSSPVTVSFYTRAANANAVGKVVQYYIYNYTGGSATAYSWNFTLGQVGIWERQTFTYTPAYGTMISYWFPQSSGVYSWDWSCMQVEQKSYVTNFVAGTRGSTVATGGGWADMSGNGNNGELVNGTRESSDNLGALVFDGTNDYISMPFETILNDCSIEIWFKATSTRSYQYLLSIGNEVNSSYSFYLDMNDPDGSGFAQTMWVYWNSGGTLYSVIPKTGTYGDWNDSTWRHYVFTRSSTTNHYMNGSLVTNVSRSGDQTTQFGNGSGYKLKIGVYQANTYAFPGNVASVKIYNRALTAAEIQQNFNATRGRYGI